MVPSLNVLRNVFSFSPTFCKLNLDNMTRPSWSEPVNLVRRQREPLLETASLRAGLVPTDCHTIMSLEFNAGPIDCGKFPDGRKSECLIMLRVARGKSGLEFP